MTLYVVMESNDQLETPVRICATPQEADSVRVGCELADGLGSGTWYYVVPVGASLPQSWLRADESVTVWRLRGTLQALSRAVQDRLPAWGRETIETLGPLIARVEHELAATRPHPVRSTDGEADHTPTRSGQSAG